MFKDLQLTLYDIFGYLLPGAVILLAIGLLFWTLFWSSAPLPIPSKPPYIAVVGFLFAAYLAGHLGQGIGNLLDDVFVRPAQLQTELPLSPELAREVRTAAKSRFGKAADLVDREELFGLCDQALLHRGSLGEREIFTYRGGFYRGNSVALTLLSLAVVIRLIRTPILVDIFGSTVELRRGSLGLTAVLAAVGAVLAFRRYLRFVNYSYRSCFLRFLSLYVEDSYGKRGSE